MNDKPTRQTATLSDDQVLSWHRANPSLSEPKQDCWTWQCAWSCLYHLPEPGSRPFVLQGHHHHPSAEKVTSCPSVYRPVALIPTTVKCFERLVTGHMKSCLPTSLDPLQFAYHPNRSTGDAISSALHLALSHLDNTYVSMLFIDFSSAFNTIISQKLIWKITHWEHHLCSHPTQTPTPHREVCSAHCCSH